MHGGRTAGACPAETDGEQAPHSFLAPSTRLHNPSSSCFSQSSGGSFWVGGQPLSSSYPPRGRRGCVPIRAPCVFFLPMFFKFLCKFQLVNIRCNVSFRCTRHAHQGKCTRPFVPITCVPHPPPSSSGDQQCVL